jgi:mono/diheme cytochrome c family protein
VKLFIHSWLRQCRVLLSVISLAGCFSACSYTNSADDLAPCNLPATVSYQLDVLPILKQQCYRCHQADKYKVLTSNTLNMEDFGSLKYYATPSNGRNNVSYLVGNIRHDEGFNPMPDDGGKLSDCDIALIKAWVDAGAPNN